MVLNVAPFLSLNTTLEVWSKICGAKDLTFMTSTEKDSAFVPSAFIVKVCDTPLVVLFIYIAVPSFAMILLIT